MSRRARHRGERLPALFGFDDGKPTEEPEIVPDNPMRRHCRRDLGGCGALPGDRCTRGGRGGRVELHGYHDTRKAKPTNGNEDQ